MLKFWSQIGLFLQVVLVVVAVVAFSLFDPFGWLKSKKLTLEDTPISVRSIREVGQLISAEYYGEVLTSLQESMVADIAENRSEDSITFVQLKQAFDEAVYDLREQKSTIRLKGFSQKKKLYALFYHQYSVTSHPFYQAFVHEMIDKKDASGNALRIGGKKIKSEKNLLKLLYDLDDKEIEPALESLDIGYPEMEARFREEVEVITGNKQFRKRQIVVLGRGWVKAGIDFGTFSEANFRYDKANRTIHLIGMHPEILRSTINPWFIPEKQIKGFEVVLITRRAKKPEYMQIVKKRTLQKLRQQAIQSGILHKAKENAEANLKSFFSLLIPEGIEEVVIHDDFFSYFDASFVSDTLTAATMRSIDSLFVSRYRTDSAAVVALRDTLKNRRVYLEERAYPANRYASRIEMAEDGTLDRQEMNWLQNERDQLVRHLALLQTHGKSNFQPHLLDSVWFFPGSEKVEVFREEVRKAFPTSFSWRKVISKHPDYVENQRKKRDRMRILVHEFMLKQKMTALDELTVELRNHIHQVVNGEVTYLDSTLALPGSTTNLENQSFEWASSQQMEALLPLDSSGIHSLKISTKPSTVTLSKTHAAMTTLQETWPVDQEKVLQKRNEILDSWTVKYAVNDSAKVSGYYLMRSYGQDARLDSSETKALLREFKALQEANSYLHDLKLSQQSRPLVSQQNDLLHHILYYPSPSQLDSMEIMVKDRRYWATAKRKRTLQKRYREVLLQRYIYRKRRQDFNVLLNELFPLVEEVMWEGVLYRRSNGVFGSLPADLHFLRRGKPYNM